MGRHAWFDGTSVLRFGHETDRRNFLRWAGLVGVGSTLAAGGAAAVAGTAGAAPRPAAATADGKDLRQKNATPQDADDIGILNYALTLEYLESDFYARGVQAGILSGRDQELVAAIAQHEAAHVTAISGVITSMGGTPVSKPTITYPPRTFTTHRFLRTAATFEELGVEAYHGQVPLIQSTDVLAAAASIAGVESRHAAVLDKLICRNPFPRPIEKHEPKSYVLARVTPFLS